VAVSAMSSLSHLWGEYLKQSDKVSNSELLKNKSSQNITFMKKMGFSPDFIESYIEKYEFSEAAMRIWKQGYYNGQNSELGFIHQKHSNSKVYANFTNAKPGAGISLSFFGKYTEIYYTNLKDVIAIEKMETDGIKKLKYKDKRAWVYFALTLPLLYFILGLIKLTPASRIAIILGVLLIIPWVIDFVRFLRKSGPRL